MALSRKSSTLFIPLALVACTQTAPPAPQAISFRGATINYEIYEEMAKACAGCLIDSTCYPDRSENPDNSCEKCDIQRNSNDWRNEGAELCEAAGISKRDLDIWKACVESQCEVLTTLSPH